LMRMVLAEIEAMQWTQSWTRDCRRLEAGRTLSAGASHALSSTLRAARAVRLAFSVTCALPGKGNGGSNSCVGCTDIRETGPASGVREPRSLMSRARRPGCVQVLGLREGNWRSRSGLVSFARSRMLNTPMPCSLPRRSRLRSPAYPWCPWSSPVLRLPYSLTAWLRHSLLARFKEPSTGSCTSPRARWTIKRPVGDGRTGVDRFGMIGAPSSFQCQFIRAWVHAHRDNEMELCEAQTYDLGSCKIICTRGRRTAVSQVGNGHHKSM
jgi:hypothetical protein